MTFWLSQFPTEIWRSRLTFGHQRISTRHRLLQSNGLQVNGNMFCRESPDKCWPYLILEKTKQLGRIVRNSRRTFLEQVVTA